MELRSRTASLHLRDLLQMGVAARLLDVGDALAEGDRHFALVDFLVQLLLLFGQIRVQLCLPRHWRGGG